MKKKKRNKKGISWKGSNDQCINSQRQWNVIMWFGHTNWMQGVLGSISGGDIKSVNVVA